VRLIKVGVVEVGGQSYDLCLDSRVSTDNFSLLRVELNIPILNVWIDYNYHYRWRAKSGVVSSIIFMHWNQYNLCRVY